MSPRVDAFVDRHGWQIIAGLVSALIAFLGLQAQVKDKAERSDVLSAERRLDTKIDSVARDVNAVLYLMCRKPEYRNDSVCK